MSKNEEKAKDKKVNINYLEFISDLVKNKTEVTELNKEEIEKKYSEIVSLKFSNLKRVSTRNSRKEVIEKRNKFLVNELKVEAKDYNRVDKLVVSLANKRSNKYL